jgi:LAO/AO transport system kinase
LKHLTSIDKEFDRLQSGDRIALSQLITKSESTKIDDQAFIDKIIFKGKDRQKLTRRIGITGAPGVGKSTLIEKIGLNISSQGRKLAILAVDPSSSVTQGSILGDKTRMNDISKLTNVYIRPSPSKNFLGGIAENTRKAIQLCEIAGYDDIIVETVGIGQSEHDVSQVVDMTIWVGIAGAGDELQAVKRGIMEWADLFVINKVEEMSLDAANLAKSQLLASIKYLPKAKSGSLLDVILISAIESKGLDILMDKIYEYFNKNSDNKSLNTKRLDQANEYFDLLWRKEIANKLLLIDDFRIKFESISDLVVKQEVSVEMGVDELNKYILNKCR